MVRGPFIGSGDGDRRRTAVGAGSDPLSRRLAGEHGDDPPNRREVVVAVPGHRGVGGATGHVCVLLEVTQGTMNVRRSVS